MHRWIVVFFCLSSTACMDHEDTGTEPLVVAKKMFDAFNRHQWKEMAKCYRDSASFLDPSFGKTYVVQSREEVAAKYNGMHRLFPDIHDEVVNIYASGDQVTVEFISTGRMNDSTSFTLPIVTLLTIQNGFIVKDATYYDVENP